MERGSNRSLSPVDLSAYVDGDLGRWRRWRIARHLARCEPCRRYVEQITSVARSMRALEPAPPGADVVSQAQLAYARWRSTRSR